MGTWSAIKLGDGVLKAVGIGTGAVGRILSGPVGVAISAVSLLQTWVEADNAEILVHARQREGCPHIGMISGSPPSIAALSFVAQWGGVAWIFGDTVLHYYHEEATFRPLVFNQIMLKGSSGKVTTANSDIEYQRLVHRPIDGYGCSKCRDKQKSRQR